jgi:hypothetical protein
MTQGKTAGKNIPFIVFTSTLLLFIAAAVLHAILRSWGHDLVDRGTLAGMGRWLGWTGLTLLGVTYGRTGLRHLLRAQAPWRRLAALALDPAQGRARAAQLLSLLNRSHPYIGAASVSLIYFHCYAISNFSKFLPLRVVLALLAWQAFLGLVLKAPWTPGLIKRKALLLHAQLITGAMLLLFAGFGHYRMIWG